MEIQKPTASLSALLTNRSFNLQHESPLNHLRRDEAPNVELVCSLLYSLIALLCASMRACKTWSNYATYGSGGSFSRWYLFPGPPKRNRGKSYELVRDYNWEKYPNLFIPAMRFRIFNERFTSFTVQCGPLVSSTNVRLNQVQHQTHFHFLCCRRSVWQMPSCWMYGRIHNGSARLLVQNRRTIRRAPLYFIGKLFLHRRFSTAGLVQQFYFIHIQGWAK